MTLLEVLIGTLLAILVFLGIARLMAVGISSAAQSKVETSTVTLAEQGIESMQSLSFSALPSSPVTTYFDQDGNSSDPATGAAYSSTDARVRFIRTINVASMDPKEKEITVNVQAVRNSYGIITARTTFTTRRVDY